MPADVTDEEPVRTLFDPAVDAHGRVDLLFDDAGSFDTPQDAGDRQP